VSKPKYFAGSDDVIKACAYNTTASSGIMQGLTAKSIRDNMRHVQSLLTDLRADRDGKLKPRSSYSWGSVPIITSPFLPHEQPAIQVRDICLKDGTPLLGNEFLARENAWWKEQYGMRPVAFMVGGAVAAHPKVQAMISSAVKAFDDDMLNVMFGRQP
jgi:hypothetical protein